MALEPDLTLVNLLRQTTSLPENLDLDIQVVPAAVSNRSGIAVLEFSNNGRAGNRLSDAFAVDIPSALQATATVAVPSLTLDSLLDYPSAHNMPQFIKIDVEGAEHLVLSGGAQVLAKARPIFAIEVWKENSVFVSEFLRDNGYAVFDGTNLRIGLREVHACPYDTIAIP